MIDDLMRQAGLEAIATKDSRAAAGQEMTSPEQDMYHAACYFAWLVREAARGKALEEAATLCVHIAASLWSDDLRFKQAAGANECAGAIRRLGEEAGRGESALEPLSDEQIAALWEKCNMPSEDNDWTTGPVPFARAIEAEHGIRGGKS